MGWIVMAQHTRANTHSCFIANWFDVNMKIVTLSLQKKKYVYSHKCIILKMEAIVFNKLMSGWLGASRVLFILIICTIEFLWENLNANNGQVDDIAVANLL